MITLAQLSAVVPEAARYGRLAEWYPALCAAMEKYAITTPTRESYFLANVLEETGEFAAQRENMNYSGGRLVQVFPSLFDGDSGAELADDLAAQGPEAIANFVYDDANRPPGYKLGNVHPGDGWKYRGGGPMQTTGRGNYEHGFVAAGLPADTDPDETIKPEIGSQLAAYFWWKAGCNSLADDHDFAACVVKVNGGMTNYDLRAKYLDALRVATGVMA